MSISVPLPARFLPALCYCVAALRVGEDIGEGGVDTNATQDPLLHSLLMTPMIHNESVAMVQDASFQSEGPQDPLAPALLTKMRATLLKKQSKKSTKYRFGEEVNESAAVQNFTAHASFDATNSSVRNISAVPKGAAPLQFQRVAESEFQSAAHQAVLPQMPHPNMIGSALQTLEDEVRALANLQSPEILEDEDHIPSRGHIILNEIANMSHPVNLESVSNVTTANISKESESPMLSNVTPSNISKESESPMLMQTVQGKPGDDITIRFKVDLNVRLQNHSDGSLHTEIDSAVNDTVVQPQTWFPAPSKEPEAGPLYGKPFVSDPFADGNVNSSTVEEAVRIQVEEPKVTSSSNETLPLPPRTLYGRSAPMPAGNDSFVLVDPPVSIAKVSSVAEPQQNPWFDRSSSTTQTPQNYRYKHNGYRPQTQSNDDVASAASPSPPRRASIVRRWSPPAFPASFFHPSPSGTATDSPWGVTATYYPGHWGSESPAILRDPKDDVIRKEMQEPAAIWAVLIALAILILLIILLLCGLKGKTFCPWPDGNDQVYKGEVRRLVESLHVSSPEDIEATFKPRGGYDCLLLQPQSPGIAVRIQGVVVASQQSGTLRAPITRRKCVLFSTSALERRLDGVVAPPQAFHSMAVNFSLELSPLLTLTVRGQDVALFDMVAGRHEENVVLRDASELVQDFVRSHRTPFFGARDIDVLDFQECVLEVGAKVTCVGEVRRSENGELGLWPLHHDIPSDAVPVASTSGPSGLTSWERLGSSGFGESQVEKVMISDDPQLVRWEAS